MLKKIFSITNKNKHKVICILGIKISFSIIKINKRIINKTKIKNNKILFINFVNKPFGCNPKYIALEIIKQKLPYELVWIVKNPKKERKNFPSEIRLVKYNAKNIMKEFGSAKFWISNSRLTHYIRLGLFKKEQQTYIQTWHGLLGIKKIENDIVNKEKYVDYLKIAKIDSVMTDYLISPTKLDTEILEKCYFYNNKYLEIGYPRNDIFFINEDELNKKRAKIKKALGIPENKKILFYAPTFRDAKDTNIYNLDLDAVGEIIGKKYKQEVVNMVRLHNKMQSYANEMTLKFKNSINVTLYPDMQELLLISDILITDYSSSIFDFMFQYKPAFIYANDISDYYKERGFYLDISKTCFPIAYSNEELIKIISEFDELNYINNLKAFIKDRVCYDNGTACESCVNLINTIKERAL